MIQYTLEMMVEEFMHAPSNRTVLVASGWPWLRLMAWKLYICSKIKIY